MTKNEDHYINAIFRAIPHMSEFEKGRLVGYAEALETLCNDQRAQSVMSENSDEDNTSRLNRE